MHVFAVCFLVQIKEQVFAFRCRFPGKAHLYFRTRQPVHTKDHSLPDGLPARVKRGYPYGLVRNDGPKRQA